jgi:photosystem II stability/assembly factor-like uncharacterized protein
MDRLRRDIEAIFGRRQEALGDLGGARERVLRGAFAKRAEPIGSWAQFMAGVATVVLTTLIVATFAYGRVGTNTHPYPPASSTRTNPPASPTPTTPKPNAGLNLWSIDLLEGGKGWSLLSNCNAATSNPCNYFVSATVDGGQTWSAPVQVGPSYDPTDGGAPRIIRFLNDNDGFVYGGSEGFTTHDGGHAWTSLGFQPVFVNGIIGSGQAAWAFSWPCAKAAPCSYEARLTRDGGRTWSAGQPLPRGFSPVDVVLFGMAEQGISEVFIASQQGEMVITNSGGKRFRSIPSNCKDNPFHAWIATTDGNELWELCSSYPPVNATPPSLPTPSPKAASQASSPYWSPKVLYVSQDGGLTWSKKATSQAGGKLPVLGLDAAIVSPGPHTLLLATELTGVLRSTDDGATWTSVPNSPTGVRWFRFFSPTTGWAMGAQGAIWWTSDGGLSWTRLSAYDSTP